MKLNLRNSKGILVPTIVLTVICLVMGLALAMSNAVAQHRIEQLAAEAANSARLEVLPSADGFSPLELPFSDEERTGYGILESQSAQNGAGFVLVMEAKGYGSPAMRVMVGLDASGTVQGVTILESYETPGLGLKTSDESYLSQYLGKSPQSGELTVVGGPSAADNEIVMIAGATVSSRAVTQAVQNALTAVSILLESGVA